VPLGSRSLEHSHWNVACLACTCTKPRQATRPCQPFFLNTLHHLLCPPTINLQFTGLWAEQDRGRRADAGHGADQPGGGHLLVRRCLVAGAAGAGQLLVRRGRAFRGRMARTAGLSLGWACRQLCCYAASTACAFFNTEPHNTGLTCATPVPAPAPVPLAPPTGTCHPSAL